MGRTLLGTLGMLALAASTCTMQLTVTTIEQLGKETMSGSVLAISVGVNGLITIAAAVVAFRCFSAATARNGKEKAVAQQVESPVPSMGEASEFC